MKKQCERCNKYFTRDQITYLPDYTSDRGILLCHACVEKVEEIAIANGHSHSQVVSLLKQDLKDTLEREKKKLILKPHQIKQQLDKYVIGQEDAKRDISVALFNHKRKLETKNYNNKSNLLILGPTGCGKTYIIKNACRISGLPFVVSDATNLTEAGYVGKDVEQVLSELVKQCDYDIKKAETGIVYIDEIDKLAVSKNKNTRDVSGGSVQQALLKMVEGAKVSIEMKDRGYSNAITLDTSRILFIFSGAFVGLKEIVEKRVTDHCSIGFNNKIDKKEFTSKDLKKGITIDDIINYGMIPEFMGRIPLITAIDALTKEDLISILSIAKNSIIQEYIELFELDNIKLSFTKGALNLIAEKALEANTGARGLNFIIEKVMIDIIYYIQRDGCDSGKLKIEIKNVKKVLDI